MGFNLSHLDDESLILQIKEGKHQAFEEIVNRHAKRFYSLAYRLVFNREEAEDIVQDAFLKLWNKPELWDSRKRVKFTTWFYRVVTNLCIDHNKKKKPVPLSDKTPIRHEQPGQDVLLDHQQKQVLLDNLIRELPERQQLAINLCFYEGLSNEEAAEIMGVKVKVLQSLIMRAKMTLKEKIKPYLD